ncbi:unnamed protein product [Linum tenue]|uniref:Homeobox protein knotted-1-like 1 n=1 Tax=Linum tenue TaxID=586396 RepID=A0AAV0MK24_9ROSI|nr:unnamed protein product [Linum tenue]
MEDLYTDHGDDNGDQAAAEGLLLPEAGDHDQVEEEDDRNMIKWQIAGHPLYPSLVSAHIDCQKVGAPPEVVSLLEEIMDMRSSSSSSSSTAAHNSSSCSNNVDHHIMMINDHTIGGAPDRDPELDRFMESYCELLHSYKEELSKPFQEATSFLTTMESQLTNLCKLTSKALAAAVSSSSQSAANDHDQGQEEHAESSHNYYQEQQPLGGGSSRRELREMLQRKYSGYLSNLRKEFMKKRKPGKLPKDATAALLEWWTQHRRWPYPTEEEKVKLSETTGLDQKQINNWFINQRKRHWRPSQDSSSRVALVPHPR